MNLKLKALTAGVLFFTGQALFAQEAKKDSTDTTENQIEEVVLVGYTAVKKDEQRGSFSKIGKEAINNKSVSNVAQAITGEAAGVRVITSSGQPGSNPTIRIGGFGSVNGNRDPLYVLDGVPYYGNIASINPDDIEEFNILKDASATAIYGSRGANGVVLINTKRGRANRGQISLESKIGFNTPLIPRYNIINSPDEYIALAWEGLYNQGSLLSTPTTPVDPVAYANANLFHNRKGIHTKYNLWGISAAELIDPVTKRVKPGVSRLYDPERWKDYAFQTAIRTEHNLNMSGGSGKTTFYTGIGYLKDEGYSINTKYERYSGRLNVTHQVKPWLRGEATIGYAHTDTKDNGQTEDSNNVFWFVDNMPSIYPLFARDNAGNKINDPYFGGFQYDYGEGRGFGALTNAIATAFYDFNQNKKHEIDANFFLKADITKGLSFEARIGGQHYDNSRTRYYNPYYGSSAGQQGSLFKTRSELFTWNFLQLLRYMKKFGNHNIQAFVAHESTDWRYNILSANKQGLVIPNEYEFNNAIKTIGAASYTRNYALESYFGQAIYNYAGKYILSGSIRRDGSSRFINKDKKWDTFYSAGLEWVVNKENFLKDNNFFNKLKLKASYGTMGDQSGVGFYPGYNIYDTGNFMDIPAAAFNRIGYSNLTWEKSRKYQTGIEFALFKNKVIEGSIDLYHRTTDNLIFDNRLAPSTGNAIMKVNDGLLVNKGLDFNLTAHIVNKDNFYLDFSVNGEVLKNKLTKMPTDFTTGKAKIIDLSEAGFGRAAGYSLFDYYLREWAGVNPTTGAGQWNLYYVDRNGDGIFNPADPKNPNQPHDESISSLHEFLVANPNANISVTTTEDYTIATQKFVGKSAIPDLRGAFSLRAGYKGWALSVQFLYSVGGYAYDGAYANLMSNGRIGSNNWHEDIKNRWQKPGDITDVPRLSNNNTGDTNYASRSTRFLIKSDYLALNNIRLSYSLPKDYYRGLGINGLTLSVSGDNLWLTTKRKGFNPSTSETGSSNAYRYSPLSTITFGVKVNF